MFLIVYLIVISVFSIIATANDKFKSTRGKRYNRIPESTLVTLALLGGALAMFFTMIAIKHKTRKPKFMLGLPLIIALHVCIVYLYVKLGVSTL